MFRFALSTVSQLIRSLSAPKPCLCDRLDAFQVNLTAWETTWKPSWNAARLWVQKVARVDHIVDLFDHGRARTVRVFLRTKNTCVKSERRPRRDNRINSKCFVSLINSRSFLISYWTEIILILLKMLSTIFMWYPTMWSVRWLHDIW